VRRLKEAGAVIVGKNNLHEFAYGGSSLVSHFGDVHNPWDVERIAGGSSGGSAAAVAAGLCYAAIGTDTAGSIREPAALCGCVGLKPTYGRVSARGVIPLSWSLDHIGPLACRSLMLLWFLQAIAGYDPDDSCLSGRSCGGLFGGLARKLQAVTRGVPRAHFFEDLDPEVASALDQVLAEINALVKEVKDVRLDVPADRTVQARSLTLTTRRNVSKTPELYQSELCAAFAPGRIFLPQTTSNADANWTTLAAVFAQFSPTSICL